MSVGRRLFPEFPPQGRWSQEQWDAYLASTDAHRWRFWKLRDELDALLFGVAAALPLIALVVGVGLVA